MKKVFTMLTRNKQIIMTGIKHNSMYEPNSVIRDVTKEELEQFYADSENLNVGAKKLIKKPRKPYKLGRVEEYDPKGLIIET